MNKYNGDWCCVADIEDDFRGHYNYGTGTPTLDLFPTEEEVLFAMYTYEDYSGDAFVLFEYGGKLYTVEAGHCSCDGLKGSWEPGETSWKALAMRFLDRGERPNGYYASEVGKHNYFLDLIRSRVSCETFDVPPF